MKTLRLILGDQLNSKHSWYKEVNPNVIYCLFEMRQETDYVVHHIQKIIGFFAAMRHFCSQLINNHHHVVYFKIGDDINTHNLIANLNILIQEHSITAFEYQEPDEYRLDVQLKNFCKNLSIPYKMFTTEHFYAERFEVKHFFDKNNSFVMENFYRFMRKKHNILMIDNQPLGRLWNYDKQNRNQWNEKDVIPTPIIFENNVEEIVQDIGKLDIKTIGSLNSKYFNYPISRLQALEQLNFFCEALLPHFGDYQDAMHTHEAFLFHSRLSFALNLKLISAKEVVNTSLCFYQKFQNKIHISQIEGFVRQIIGWREYMRGMYWARMPEFKNENHLKNTNTLPDFFWTGKTKMNCLSNTIKNSLENAYAHHIQRLMITGNYALLTQINPDKVDAWYLGIYIDAIEWVQLPNTRGMSQWADGGKIATKPYISSGSYIAKMSNYCDSCYYNKSKKTEADACPFNSLYWNFLDMKREYLHSNFRMKMMYSVLDKMNIDQLNAIKTRAQHIIMHQDEY